MTNGQRKKSSQAEKPTLTSAMDLMMQKGPNTRRSGRASKHNAPATSRTEVVGDNTSEVRLAPTEITVGVLVDTLSYMMKIPKVLDSQLNFMIQDLEVSKGLKIPRDGSKSPFGGLPGEGDDKLVVTHPPAKPGAEDETLDDVFDEVHGRGPLSERLPIPDTLEGQEELAAILDSYPMYKDLGYINAHDLLTCGYKEISTICGSALVSPYIQYLIRVLDVYYANYDYPEDPTTVVEFLASLQSSGTSIQPEQFAQATARLSEYGYLQIIEPFCPAVCAIGENLEEVRSVSMTSLENLLTMYPGAGVLVKLIVFCQKGFVSYLHPPLEGTGYMEVYDRYLSLVCSGTGSLDNVAVNILPKEPSTTTTMITHQQPSVVTQKPRGGASPRTLVMDKYAPAPDIVMGEAQSSIPLPLAPVGVPNIRPAAAVEVEGGPARTTYAGTGSRSLTNVQSTFENKLGILEFEMKDIQNAFKKLMEYVNGIKETVTDIQESLKTVITNQEANMLATQQQYNKALLTPAVEDKAASTGPMMSLMGGIEEKMKTKIKTPSDLIKELRQAAGIGPEERITLAHEVKLCLLRGGRPELVMNVSAENLKDPMYRARLSQNLNILTARK